MVVDRSFSLPRKFFEGWLFVATTIFILGYFIFPTTSKHNTFFYITVCSSAVLLIPFYFGKIKCVNWLTLTAIIFSFYTFVNSLWSIHYSTEQTLKYLRYLFTLYCLFGAVFFVQYRKENYSILLIKALIVIGFFYYLYGIWEHFSAFKNPLARRYSDRPIDEAIFSGVLLLGCCWFIFEQKAISYKLLYAGLSVPFIIVLLLAKSRGPQLAFILTVPLISYCLNIKVKQFFLYIIILVFVLGGLLLWTDSAGKIFSRGAHFPYRSQIWLASLQEGLEYFWFGQGASHKPSIEINTGEKFTHSHNILLAIFRMGGIVGILLFLTNFVLCLSACYKQRSSIIGFWGIWLCFGFICHLTNGQYPLTRPTSLWFAYWMPVFFICALTPGFKLKELNIFKQIKV